MNVDETSDHSPANARATLFAALLGFFVITLDAVVVNVALPTLGHELHSGMRGLQWVVDGYTLVFAALLLSAGAITDRIGARRTFGLGMGLFVLASIACGLAPSLGTLVAARFAQGLGAAMMMPSSMALIRQAYPDPIRRRRAVALWAMGGAIAASSGPVIGGLLAMLSWRWIFFVNVPAGLVTLALLSRSAESPRHEAPFDLYGQLAAIVAMAALTYGAIEIGDTTAGLLEVALAFGITLGAMAAFVVLQRRNPHPMVPAAILTPRNARIALAVGFTFMVGYFGLPFVMSLYLQQFRGLSSATTGFVFLPMMLVGLLLTPFSSGLTHRLGERRVIVLGLVLMGAGLVLIACLPSSAPLWLLSAGMAVVGLSGPLIAPPIAAVLLSSVPARMAGTASGLFNTSRQVGGALAVAIFGALLTKSADFMTGVRISLAVAAGIALIAALISLRLEATTHSAS